MSKAKQTLTQAFLERISRGSVPMGGFYWVDPKEIRGRSDPVKAADIVNAAAGVVQSAGVVKAAGIVETAEGLPKGRDVTGRGVTGLGVTAPNAAAHGLYAARAGERS